MTERISADTERLERMRQELELLKARNLREISETSDMDMEQWALFMKNVVRSGLTREELNSIITHSMPQAAQEILEKNIKDNGGTT